ncbi:MAG: ferritin-like domain-containing protein [Bacillota bacterium]|nr:ferritin-like domain-containing protein [Bacillota bacterium]
MFYDMNFPRPAYNPSGPAPFNSQAYTQNTEMYNAYVYPQNLPTALQLIQDAVEGETEDRLFYSYLINTAPTEEEKRIITGIRDDEIKHFSLFRQIYFELTGQVLAPPANASFQQPATYCDGLKRALLGEQNAVGKYRKILFAMQDRRIINIMVEIITDEIRHGSLYNYLYSKNGCNV